MWCVGGLTQEYRQRMYDLPDLYGRPFRSREPVVCLDGKSKQLLKDSRQPLPIKPGTPVRLDYEYVRSGTCNLFVAIQPKGGRRTVQITDHRAKTDFVAFVRYLLEQVYARARLRRKYGADIRHFRNIASGADTNHYVYSAEPRLLAGDGATLRCVVAWQANGTRPAIA